MKIEAVKRIGASNRFRVTSDRGSEGVFLDEMIVVHSIKAGAEFDEETFAEIRFENDKKVAFELAISYLEVYAVSEQGLKKYLAKKGYKTPVIAATISKLREYEMLNDEAFAREYANSLCKKFGKRAVKQKLREKGISTELSEKILSEIDEEAEFEAAKKLAEKFFKNRQNSPETAKKCLAHLAGKGYDYGVCRRAVQSLAEVEDDWS